MIDYIISLPTADDVWTDEAPRPSPSVLIAEYDNTSAYLYSADTPAGWPPTAYVIGAWDRTQPYADGYVQEGQTVDEFGVVTGTPTYPINDEYWNDIRPLGNAEGVATGPLDSLRWQGAPEAKYAVETERYPGTDRPFNILFTRVAVGIGAPVWDSTTAYFTGDYVQSPAGTYWQALQDSLNQTPFGGSAFWEFINGAGWGWKAEMISDDPLRDIQARAIGIYSDPEWQNFLYTTGSFNLDPDTGLYTTVCPPGSRTASPEPIYYALLLGSEHEGNWQLTDEADGASTEALHWLLDQGDSARSVVVESAGVNATAAPENVYTPSGIQIVEAGSINAARLYIALEGGQRDPQDPTLTLYLPSGEENIGFVWNRNNQRYQSGAEAGIRLKLLAARGQRIKISLDWN